MDTLVGSTAIKVGESLAKAIYDSLFKKKSGFVHAKGSNFYPSISATDQQLETYLPMTLPDIIHPHEGRPDFTPVLPDAVKKPESLGGPKK